MVNIYLRPQLWWRVAIVVGGVVGLLIGDPHLAYYTCQSNLVTAGYFGGVVYWMIKRGTVEPAAPRLRGPVTLCILITCLVSHFLLNNGENPLPGLFADDPADAVHNRGVFLLHYAVPIMVLIDWLAFGPHRASPWRDLPLWLILPLGYGVLSIFRAVTAPEIEDRYPYFFLNPTDHGYGWVTLQMIQLAAEFAVLGAALLGLDRLVSRRAPAPAPAEPL